MIIVNIAGGLGNQMFQFAFGKAISIDMKQDVYYCIDALSSYDSVREFELESAFNLILPRAHHKDLAHVLSSWRSLPSMRRILAGLNNPFLRGPNFITENTFDSSSRLSLLKINQAYFHGYWQSEDFFKSQENIVRELFKFKRGGSSENQKIIERIRLRPSIAMHVRRGDYVTNSKANAMHGVLDTKYYFSAIASMRKRVPNSRLFIFTDDFNWVQKEVLPKVENAECVSINTGRESFRDMQLMAICDHNIVSNSTFSWWSAWLNPNPQKIVIAPQKWFSGVLPMNNSPIPDAWERI